MTNELWNEARRIFDAALDLDPQDRGEFVARECAAKPELLAIVTDLLKADSDTKRLVTPLREPWGDFQLAEELGRGGNGIVYRAWDPSLKRWVAVKILRRRSLTAAETARFKIEAELASRLRHPHIVRVLASGEHESEPFFVMDYVAGTDLGKLVQEASSSIEQGGTRQIADLMRVAEEAYPRAVARMIQKVARALHFAHTQNVLHRDVKPSNILWGEDGEPYLVDFGVARDLERATMSETHVGTTYYMSPEQARIREAPVDRRTDIFSLGVVTYELLALTKPFDGDTEAQVLQAIQNVQPRQIQAFNPDVPPELSLIVQTAMHKNPNDRYADAAVMAEDLQRLLDGRSVLARPLPWRRRVVLAISRHRLWTTAAGLAVLAILCSMFAVSVARAADLRAEIANCQPSSEPVAGLDGKRLDDAIDRVADKSRWLASLHPRSSGAHRQECKTTRQALERRAEALFQRTASLYFRAENAPSGLLNETIKLRMDRLLALARSTALLPESSAGAPDLASQLRPTVSLVTDPPQATVCAVPLDVYGTPLAAKVVRLGSTPLARVPIPAGYYRVFATHADGRFGEVTRLFSRYATEYQLPTLTLRRVDGVAGMVSIAAGPFRRRGDRSRGVPTEPKLEGFLIDKDEATNAAFRAFLIAYPNQPTPDHWPIDWRTNWKVAWDLLPATGMDFFVAEAFAAWSGKRLPTAIEWERSAGGTTGYSYPWGETPLPTIADANAGQPDPPGLGAPYAPGTSDAARRAALWANYLAQARPVGSFAKDASPDGLRDVLGNANEWTETFKIAIDATRRLEVAPTRRITMGASFEGAVRVLQQRYPCSARSRSVSRGFRCAKSAASVR